MKLKVVGFDPSTSAWGSAQCLVDIDTLAIEITGLRLTETESEKKQGVQKNSDDLRRALELRKSMLEVCEGHAMAVSEIPFFNPGSYAAANYNSGLVIGVLTGCPLPLIQVYPKDVKEATAGHKFAVKEEMIEWAVAAYPLAPWLTIKRGGKVSITKKNEHLADAVAAVHAGVKTAAFKNAIAMMQFAKAA